MKKINYIYISLLSALVTFSSCGDWLTVYPENNQVSDTYWQSKEDVEAVVNSGYYYLRAITETHLIPYGELRGGAIYSRVGNSLQTFQVKSSQKMNSDWGPFYRIVNVANAVLEKAHIKKQNNDTYEEAVMKSHLSEAYFQRDLSYFYIVRNWRDAPLILNTFEDDSKSYHIAKSTESQIIEQIKNDIRAALATGAAKESFNTTWETKGRGTKWALYALMADVCLWSEDYQTAITFCDYLLEANNPKAPVFMSTPSRASWFTIFNPGNSNESIFEIQWNHEVNNQTNSLPILFDNLNTSRVYELTTEMLRNFTNEYGNCLEEQVEPVRSMYGGYFVTDPLAFEIANNGFVWKYCGGKTQSDKRTATYYDPNFIIYRMADVVLMKAEAKALIADTPENRAEAVEYVNKIRVRSNLNEHYYTDDMSQEDVLDLILDE